MLEPEVEGTVVQQTSGTVTTAKQHNVPEAISPQEYRCENLGIH
jgi:hypothetical protein